MVSHPSNLLPLYTALAAAELGSNFHFEFSRYVYIPQQISEKRDWFTIPAENAEEAWKQSTSSLKAHEEIALHSRVTGHQGMRHLPFLDMGCAHIENHLDDLKLAFKDFNIPKMTIFSSGRSYHIYGHGLLRDDASLVRFMGRILLLNLPQKERVIDERWVGHRLMAGYLTLRWTHNNPYYKTLPKFLLETTT